jgi:hypothetical protein
MIRTIVSTHARRVRNLTGHQSVADKSVKILRDGKGNAVKIIKIRG